MPSQHYVVTPQGHGLGYRPDLGDIRDCYFAAESVQVPASADLSDGCGPVLDQGQLGSCTANAGAGVYQFEQKRQGLTDFTASRLAIYYNERALEHSVNQDSGARVRDCLKVMGNPGVCPEEEWPYDIELFAQKPPAACYQQGKADHALKYLRVRQNLGAMKACLAAGYPIIFGFTVYESFESSTVAETGRVPMPQTTEQVLGGHCVYLIGYSDYFQRFTVRNSWGEGWGDGGNCSMPYAYLLDPNLASDFWKLTLVSA